MSRKFWKRLAGCIVINFALAAAPEYQAGTASVGDNTALVLKDCKGNSAVIVESQSLVTKGVSDFVAAQLAKTYGLDRAALLIYGRAVSQPTRPDDVLTAIAAALGRLESASVSYDGTAISVATLDRKCIYGPCSRGVPVGAPIRTAFQMVEPEHGLQPRGTLPAAYPVHAIAFGKAVAILGLSGQTRYPATKSLIVIPFANDAATPPESPRIAAAIRRVLARVGRSTP